MGEKNRDRRSIGNGSRYPHVDAICAVLKLKLPGAESAHVINASILTALKAGTLFIITRKKRGGS
jgi:hypothetical protein